jgi:hypothetical protein
MTDNTLTQQQLLDQMAKMAAQIDALSALVSKSKKAPADPSAPAAEKKKRAPPDASAWNAQVSSVWEEMKASYRSENPAAADLSDEEIRKQTKEGKLPPLPTYSQALQEASRRKRSGDAEHDKKAAARRAQISAKQAEKKSSKKATAPAPAPAPSPKPSAEPTIETITPNANPEELSMRLKMPNGETYLLNAENWVCTDSEDPTWVGLWDPETKTIDRTAPEPTE